MTDRNCRSHYIKLQLCDRQLPSDGRQLWKVLVERIQVGCVQIFNSSQNRSVRTRYDYREGGGVQTEAVSLVKAHIALSSHPNSSRQLRKTATRSILRRHKAKLSIYLASSHSPVCFAAPRVLRQFTHELGTPFCATLWHSPTNHDGHCLLSTDKEPVIKAL